MQEHDGQKEHQHRPDVQFFDLADKAKPGDDRLVVVAFFITGSRLEIVRGQRRMIDTSEHYDIIQGTEDEHDHHQSQAS